VSPGAATLDRPARTGGCYLDCGVYFATDGVSPSCFKASRTFIRSSSISTSLRPPELTEGHVR